ncbi:MAG: hypothetical protein ACM3Q1_03865 [Bacteroidales bacterium]
MTLRVVLAHLLVGLLAATPALAQSDTFCRGDVRNAERELALRGDRLSATDRVQAQQRLSRAEGLCFQDSTRARQDLEQLQRELVQQATRPGDQPALPGTGPGRY